jgi:histidinol-phosphate/aromatic aminotransferase/cobyric acid decarboxylase-like protein
MTFREFQVRKSELLSARPLLRNLTYHDVPKALAAIERPRPAVERVHRCDLSRQWLKAYSLPHEWPQRTLISQGVRHSLRLLFRVYASKRRRALIPQDVYPVYGSIATEEGLDHDLFATVPEIRIGVSCADILLVPNPVVPRGDHLRQVEIDDITSWVSQHPDRRVVIDGVYEMQTNLDSGTLRLLDTGQAIFLTSLSKLWLSPQVIGVAVVPPDDAEDLFVSFSEATASPGNLRMASALLTDGGTLALSVSTALANAKAALNALLASEGIEVPAVHSQAGYYTLLDHPWQQLLDKHNILTIPFEVFGGNPARSVATSLAFI